MLTTYIVVVADDDARFIGRRKITRKETMHGSGSGLHVHIFLSSQLSSKYTSTNTTAAKSRRLSRRTPARTKLESGRVVNQRINHAKLSASRLRKSSIEVDENGL